MTEEKTSGFNFLVFLKPIADISISGRRVYLYRLRVSDTQFFLKLTGNITALSRVRSLLECIASEDNSETERKALDSEFIKNLSDDEIEKISEAYIATSYIQKISNELQNALSSRASEEFASSYLNALITAHVIDATKKTEETVNKIMLPFSSLFDQVKKSSSTLGDSLGAYENYRNTKLESINESFNQSKSIMAAQNEAFQKLEKERADELKMVSLTAEMTAQSAVLLKNLSDAATIFLEQSEERSIRENKTTKLQLWIAVWSVIVSVILSAVSLYLSLLSFRQGQESNLVNDKLQKRFVEFLDESVKRDSAFEQQNLKLQEQILISQKEKQRVVKVKSIYTNKHN